MTCPGSWEAPYATGGGGRESPVGQTNACCLRLTGRVAYRRGTASHRLRSECLDIVDHGDVGIDSRTRHNSSRSVVNPCTSDSDMSLRPKAVAATWVFGVASVRVNENVTD